MDAFDLANGEKAVFVLLAVISWLVAGKFMQRDRQNYLSLSILTVGAALFVFIGFLGVKLQMQIF